MFLRFIIAFTLTLSNSFAKNIYFLGTRGEFYQSLFRNDPRVNDYLSKNINEAEIIIMLEPEIEEAKKILREENFRNKKVLFAFYYNRPQNFASLPHLYLSTVSEFLDTIENQHVSNSPFEKPNLTPKVKLAIQYEVWMEVFRHLNLSRKISELSEI